MKRYRKFQFQTTYIDNNVEFDYWFGLMSAKDYDEMYDLGDYEYEVEYFSGLDKTKKVYDTIIEYKFLLIDTDKVVEIDATQDIRKIKLEKLNAYDAS